MSKTPISGTTPMLPLASMSSVQLASALSVPLFASIGVAGTVWLRMAVAALALLLVVRPRGLGRRELAAAAALGVVTGANTALFGAATDRIPLGVAVAIEFCGPLAVAVFSPAARLRGRLGWPLVALAGVLLLTQPWTIDDRGQGRTWLGLALAACAAAGWATYIVLTAHVGRLIEGLSGLAVSLTVAAFELAPLGAPQVWTGVRAGGHWGSIGECALVALLAPLGAFALETLALRRMPTAVFGVWMALEPAFAVLAGLLLLGQRISPAQLPGVALVIAAGVATQRSQSPGSAGYPPVPEP
jgi:inner membrane transporter RhtA